jgi:hypothetical protein
VLFRVISIIIIIFAPHWCQKWDSLTCVCVFGRTCEHLAKAVICTSGTVFVYCILLRGGLTFIEFVEVTELWKGYRRRRQVHQEA